MCSSLGIRGEGAVVCLHAAPRVQLFASAGNEWPHNARHFRDCKALLSIVEQCYIKYLTFTFYLYLFADTERHLPWITQCYLTPTQVTPARQADIRFTYSGRMEGSVALDGWLHNTYRDGLPVHRQSPIQVVTGPGVEQLH